MEWIIGLIVLWVIGSLGSGGGNSSSSSSNKNSRTTHTHKEEFDSFMNAMESKRKRRESLVRELTESQQKKSVTTSSFRNAINDSRPTQPPETSSSNAHSAERRSLEWTSSQVSSVDPNLVKKNIPSRKEEIEFFAKERGIEYLVHFTQVENVSDILTHGLLGRLSLQSRSIPSRFNDRLRLDNVPNAISASISFPNYKMFYGLQKSNENTAWAIIKLKASILWEIECAFNITNAASNGCTAIPLNTRKEAKSLKAMFDDFPSPRTRSNLNIPNNYTTDPQGEILILGDVSPKYITSVSFNDASTVDYFSRVFNKQMFSAFCANIKFVHDTSLFKPRVDWKFWTGNNQSERGVNIFNDNTPPPISDDDIPF